MKNCLFCNLALEPNQKVLLRNEHCLFLQLKQAEVKGAQLEGSGVIVPKQHRETVFDLTEEEWKATYELLMEAKQYIDEKHEPDGYNVGWNCGEVGGNFLLEIDTIDAPGTGQIAANGQRAGSDAATWDFYNDYYSNPEFRSNVHIGDFSVGEKNFGSARVEGMLIQHLQIQTKDLAQ